MDEKQKLFVGNYELAHSLLHCDNSQDYNNIVYDETYYNKLISNNLTPKRKKCTMVAKAKNYNIQDQAKQHTHW